MSTLALPMASPRSLKRTCDDAGLEEPLQDFHVSAARSKQAPSVPSGATQEPARSQVTGDAPLPTNSASINTSIPAAATSHSAAKPKPKRSKLSFEEKEVQRIEKEFKERQKAEEKARKEEEKAKKEAEKEAIERQKAQEKAKKEEERRLKELEKEEKRKAKEEQVRIKLEEKKQKEEESNRKAKNQLRMDSFFTRNNGTSGSPARDTHSPLSSRRSSVSEVQAIEGHRRSPSASLTPSRARKSDYEQNFQEFPSKPNTVVAPHNRFSRDERGLAFVQEKVDKGVQIKREGCKGPSEQGLRRYLADMLHMPVHDRPRRPRQFHGVKDIMAAIDGTTSNPIDLTDSQFQRAARKPLDLLKTLPVKYLKFDEDVRPPYTGTCTRLQDSHTISKIARNPFGRDLPETDYNYDSEAEWEEPAEGEDLDSEGEEEPDEDDVGDEMDEFLDDEEATEATRAVKRRPMLGDQEPKCTGVCWEGPEGHCLDDRIAGLDWRLLKLDILMDNPQLPIDPYCSTYWQPMTTSSSLQPTQHAQGSLMEPPRLPLHPTNRQNTILSSSALSGAPKASDLDASAPMKPAKAQRLIAPELMDEFKAAVEGSDLNKLAIVEILKKQFSKQPKDAIKTTLEMVAERVGTKMVEKRWVLKSGV